MRRPFECEVVGNIYCRTAATELLLLLRRSRCCELELRRSCAARAPSRSFCASRPRDAQNDETVFIFPPCSVLI